MAKKIKTTTDTPIAAGPLSAAAAQARLDAAVAAVPETARARDEARRAKEAARTTSGTPIHLDHASAIADRDALLAEDELVAARDAAKLAGCGEVEEMGHPRRFAVAELRAALEPMLAERERLEQALADLDDQAQATIEAAEARRAEVAAARPADSPLGPPAPVPSAMWRVLVEASRQRRSGRPNKHAVAASAGWLGAGGGSVPEAYGPLPFDEFVDVAATGVQPYGPRNTGRIRQLEMEIDRLETIAAEMAERKAEEDRKRAEAAREREHEMAAAARRREAEAAERQRERDEETRAAAAKREAGRKALASGTLATPDSRRGSAA